MVFDGSGPLVKRCDGFDGSLWSKQSLSSIGTGNMSESYVEAKTVLSMRKKLLSNSEIIAG